MGEGAALIGKLVRVDLRGVLRGRSVLLSNEDPFLDGKIGLVVGRVLPPSSWRPWIVLIDGVETQFDGAFLEVVNEIR